MSRLRSLSLLSFVLAFTTASAAQAQLAHLSIRSADDVLTEVRRVAALAGREEIVQQIDGMQLLAGPKDLAGIDRKKPVGLYLLPADETPLILVAFLPIADEKKLLTTLRLMGVEVKQGEKDAHELTTAEGLKLTLRFAHGHAHLAPALTPLPERLPNPARFLPADHRELVLGDLKLDRLERDVSRSLEGLADLALRFLARGSGNDPLDALKKGFELSVIHGKRADVMLEVDPKNSRLGLDVTVKPTEKGRLMRLAGLAARIAGTAEVDVSLGDRGSLRVRLRAAPDEKK